MDENFRKKITIVFIIAVFFAIIVLIYFFFIKKPTIISLPPNNNNSPFGNNISYTASSTQGSNNNNQDIYTDVQSAPERKLVKIWDKPTAGFSFVDQTVLVTSTTTKIIKGTSTEVTIQTKATSSKIYFVDSITGFVYAYDLNKQTTYQISNTTIPAIHDAYIFNNGENILLRYSSEDTVRSLTAKIPSVIEGNSPLSLYSVSYLPNNISSVAESPFDKTISYVLPNSNGSTINTITNKGNSSIRSSLFSDWLISYGGNNLYLTTKPSSYINGYTSNINESILLRDKTGLNSLPSKTGNNILNSFLSNVGIKDFIMSTKTGNISYLNFQTLSEKCEWGANDKFVLCGVPSSINVTDGALPDAWYKGDISFSDNLYLKDLTTLKEELFFKFSLETNETIDMIKLKLNQNQNYLGFINKIDKSLWVMKTNYLNNKTNLVD